MSSFHTNAFFYYDFSLLHYIFSNYSKISLLKNIYFVNFITFFLCFKSFGAESCFLHGSTSFRVGRWGVSKAELNTLPESARIVLHTHNITPLTHTHTLMKIQAKKKHTIYNTFITHIEYNQHTRRMQPTHT